MCVIWSGRARDDERIARSLDVKMMREIPKRERGLVDALAVFVFDSNLRATLLRTDPKAYQQAVDALVDFGVLRVTTEESR